jgi:hypothetical protein
MLTRGLHSIWSKLICSINWVLNLHSFNIRNLLHALFMIVKAIISYRILNALRTVEIFSAKTQHASCKGLDALMWYYSHPKSTTQFLHLPKIFIHIHVYLNSFVTPRSYKLYINHFWACLLELSSSSQSLCHLWRRKVCDSS